LVSFRFSSNSGSLCVFALKFEFFYRFVHYVFLCVFFLKKKTHTKKYFEIEKDRLYSAFYVFYFAFLFNFFEVDLYMAF
jgi:hypothetical protein